MFDFLVKLFDTAEFTPRYGGGGWAPWLIWLACVAIPAILVFFIRRKKNRQLVEAEEALRGLNAELERRVSERTAELARVNAALQEEIAERKRAQEHLTQQREWLRVTLASIGDGVIATDPRGQVVFLNPVAEQLTGWRQDESLHRPLDSVFHIIHEQTRLPVPAPVAQVIDQGVTVALANHTTLVARDGTERPIEDSAAPIRDDEGRILGAVLVFRDASERRRAAEARAYLAAIVESSGDAILAKSLDGTITSWNTAAERLYGYTAEEVVGQPVSVLLPPGREAEIEQIMQQVRQGVAVPAYETARLRKDKTTVAVSVQVSPIRASDGRLIGASSVARDVSERRRMEQALRQAVRDKDETLTLLDSLLAHAPVGFAFFDPGCRFIRVNGFLAELDGVSAPAHLGRPVREVLPASGPAIEAALLRVFASGAAARDLEIEGEPAPSGAARHWLTSFYPVTTPDGQTTMAGAVVMEITAHKRAEAALKAADRRKDEFLAMLGHELRNPLAPIRNAVHILQLIGPVDAMVKQARDMIDRQTAHMARLIDDLLDVSRVRRGKVLLRQEHCDLVPVVRQTVEDFRPLVEKGGLTLHLDLPGDPLPVHGDRTRLAQVVGNLLHNSSKFTDRGGCVTVRLRAEPGGAAALLTVQDTGIGMEPDMLARAFDAFSQADRSLDRSRGGLGLGLALIKGLVELHGGTVTAASAGLGEGAAFTVRLPLAGTPAERPVEPAAPAGEDSRRVLVIEDHVDSAHSMRLALELSGCRVEVAHNGADGVQAARRFRPDVVLCDIGLPGGMDGFMVAQALRHDPHVAGVYLVAVTGYGQEEDRRRGAEVGFDQYLTKPVDFDRLRQLLAELPPARAMS